MAVPWLRVESGTNAQTSRPDHAWYACGSHIPLLLPAFPGCGAAVILIYGANRALRPPFMDMSASSQEAMAYEEAAEAGEMQLHTTFMFVITASCSLVLIFYFMSGGILYLVHVCLAQSPGRRLILLRCWGSHVGIDIGALLLHFVAGTRRAGVPLRRPLHRPPIFPGDRCAVPWSHSHSTRALSL